MFSVKSILNENGTVTAFTQFKEKYGINTDSMTDIGIVLAVRRYIRKTGLPVHNNGSDHAIKTVKVIYSGHKGARLYYEVLILDVKKPNCCDNQNQTEQLNLTGVLAFKKIERIREIKLKWFIIRLVHMILATNVVLTYLSVENDVTAHSVEKNEMLQSIFSGDVIT